MVPLWIVFIVTTFSILVILWYMQYFKYKRHLGRYGGPSCLPIIGNIHHFGLGKDFLPSILKLSETYGETFNVMFGYNPRLFTSGIKLTEFVLNSNILLEKSYDYQFFHSWLGLGLLTSSGAKWKQSRKFLTPAFHFKILEQFVDIFNKQGNILIKKIEHFGEKEVDIFPYVTLYALDVICEATMNTTVNAQSNADSEYVKSVKEMCRIVLYRSLSAFKMWDPLYSLSRDFQKEKKALRVLHCYTNSVINTRRKEIENNPSEQIMDDADDVGSKKRITFLDLLLQCRVDGQPLPHTVIREEVDTFMFEGHDTTTSGISFILYSLSQHQDIQDKVFEEIQNICVDDSKPMTYDDLQQMKYLEQVIKESLRLYPPVPMFARTTMEDIEFDGTILPKGLYLTVMPFALHRNPNLYPDPEVFDPERFNLENSKNRSLYSYIPFSAGPRNCIGQRFAMLEVKSVVAHIIKKFKLLPAPGHKIVLVADVILKSETGLPIRFQKGNDFVEQFWR